METKMKCPICGKPEDEKFKPFCSKRCADIDLAHWLRGDYRLPSEDDVVPQEEENSEEDES
ncbi:DNA gyrase inhibitor YacG [Candidatus Bealeia paramacronuclearis]|uniref:DNA gyrase inhibitor YacG n=2 Tax=Candidatus Bealeia paramacronuclearis TaxID=1921001 RepID=A0ABZ2C5F0_9PROT|nr:DNA gyrase inhibitor YacG [Candidatus Bealeia paramacronuclearis]